MKDTNEYDLDELLQTYLSIVKVVTLCIFISVAIIIPAKFLHFDFLLCSALAIFFPAVLVCLATSAYVLYQFSKQNNHD